MGQFFFRYSYRKMCGTTVQHIFCFIKKILFFFAKSDFYSNFAEKYKERIKNAIKITR